MVAIATTVICTTTAVGKQKRQRERAEDLIRVSTPDPSKITSAHPWINIEVAFGQSSNGQRADPGTFKAWFGRCRLPNGIFEEVVDDNGVVVKKRARLLSNTTRCHFKKSKRPRNRLRFKVRASGTTRKERKLKDIDKVRFAIAEAANRPPEPLILLPDVVTPNDALTFRIDPLSGDPDGDWLTYEWNLGDGRLHRDEQSVTQSYTASALAQTTVTLTAFDGQAWGVAEHHLESRHCPLNPGSTYGTVSFSNSMLDFGSVPVGQTKTLTFTMRNTSTDATSLVKLKIDAPAGSEAFTADCTSCEDPACALGPGEDREIAVSFAPTVEDERAEAALELWATANNLPSFEVRVLGHGSRVGGTGDVPWGTSATAFYVDSSGAVSATRPDGTRVALDAGTGSCVGGALDDAPCVRDPDCPQGSCGERVCVGGTSNGSPCAGVSDCPSGSCGLSFDPVDSCADGTGSVFLLNDDVHQDPDDPARDPLQAGTILRVGLDGSRSVVTARVAEQSLVLACDRLENGKIFWAQYDVYGQDWDEREQLVQIDKNGAPLRRLPAPLVRNLNKKLGDVDPANYIDPDDGYVFFEESSGLKVTGNGETVYVANANGLYRIHPSPLAITYDLYNELFDLFPDGSILAAEVIEQGTRSTIQLYKIDPARALNGALRVEDLRQQPWATTTIHSNLGPCNEPCPRRMRINSLAVDPDGIVFVNVVTISRRGAVKSEDSVAGTVRFEPGAGGSYGIDTGFVNFEPLEQLSF